MESGVPHSLGPRAGMGVLAIWGLAWAFLGFSGGVGSALPRVSMPVATSGCTYLFAFRRGNPPLVDGGGWTSTLLGWGCRRRVT